MTDRSVFMQVPPGTSVPRVVNAIVEISKGRRSKFAVDKRTGLIKRDRYLYSSSHYPGDYGFIPQTLAEDGDALDVLVIVNEPIFICCLIEHFFATYKQLEGVHIETQGWADRESAIVEIRSAIERYKQGS